jgi:plastocyanin
MRNALLVLLLAALFALGCGCSESPPAQPVTVPVTSSTTPPPEVTPTLPLSLATPAQTSSVSDNTITIVKNTFLPSADMTVPLHSTVRWVNADDHPHRIGFEDQSFTTSTFLLGSSQSASQRFDRAGAFNYSCLIHPEMRGTITVEG